MDSPATTRPDLEQFQAYVADGRIHYYLVVVARDDGPAGRGGPAAEIEAWVSQNFPATTVDGVTVYDLGAA